MQLETKTAEKVSPLDVALHARSLKEN